MENPALVDVVGDKLAELNARRQALAQEMVAAQREAASPLSECWGEFRGLAELLAADRSDALREKVRAALRRAIACAACLFLRRGSLRRGSLRLAAVQIHFHGNGRRRDYLILQRPALTNRRTNRQGWTRVFSLAEVVAPRDLDLRDRRDALALERALSVLDLEALANG
jgi:hypothetical protein